MAAAAPESVGGASVGQGDLHGRLSEYGGGSVVDYGLGGHLVGSRT